MREKKRGELTVIYKDIAFAFAFAIVNAGNGTGFMGGKQSVRTLCKGIAESLNYYSNGVAEKEAKKVKREIRRFFALPVGSFFRTDSCGLFCNTIIHAVTMRHAGGRSTYKGVEKCIRSIYQHCEKVQIRTIAFPLLGCGTGGLDAKKVQKILADEARRHPSIESFLYVHRFKSLLEQDDMELIVKYNRHYLRFRDKRIGDFPCDLLITDDEAEAVLFHKRDLSDLLNEYRSFRKEVHWTPDYFRDSLLADCMTYEELMDEKEVREALQALNRHKDIRDELYDALLTNGRYVPSDGVVVFPKRKSTDYPHNALYFLKEGCRSDFSAYYKILTTRESTLKMEWRIIKAHEGTAFGEQYRQYVEETT